MKIGFSFTIYLNCWLAEFESILVLWSIKYTKGNSDGVKSFPSIFFIDDKDSFAIFVKLFIQSESDSSVLYIIILDNKQDKVNDCLSYEVFAFEDLNNPSVSKTNKSVHSPCAIGCPHIYIPLVDFVSNASLSPINKFEK